jgi:hypothetical protein
VRLAFRREVETRIYNTLPHHLGALLHRHPPRCPVAFIGGTQSADEGSHLFPMERPDETAAVVLGLLPSPEPA